MSEKASRLEREMGEKEGKGGEEKQNKLESGPTTVVLKVDLHCEGCAQKVKRSIKRVDGVEVVVVDMASNELMVVGKVDPVILRERVEEKTKKKVEIVSLADNAAVKPKNGGGDTENPATADGGGAKEAKMQVKEKAKAPQASNLVLKIRLPLQGCIQTIRKKIYKVKGIEAVPFDAGKDLVTIKGTLDPKALPVILKDKLKRGVEVIPTMEDTGGDKKSENAGGEEKVDGGDKKSENAVGEEEESGDGGGGKTKGGDGEKNKEGQVGEKKKEGGDESESGDKKEECGEKKKEGGSGGDSVEEDDNAVEFNKMEYYGVPYGYPVEMVPTPYEYGYDNASMSSEYWHEMAPTTSKYRYNMAPISFEYLYEKPPTSSEYQYDMASMLSEYQFETAPISFDYAPAPYWCRAEMVQAPQILSDENPNACCIM